MENEWVDVMIRASYVTVPRKSFLAFTEHNNDGGNAGEEMSNRGAMITCVRLLQLLALIMSFNLHLQAFPIDSRFALSRSDFLLGISLPFLSPTTSTNDVVEIPLTFLRLGGCLAVKISVNDKRTDTRIISYSAVVDTGSPFVTAPPEIQPYSKDLVTLPSSLTFVTVAFSQGE